MALPAGAEAELAEARRLSAEAARAAVEAALAAELAAAAKAGSTARVEHALERAIESGYAAEASTATGILHEADQKREDMGNLVRLLLQPLGLSALRGLIFHPHCHVLNLWAAMVHPRSQPPQRRRGHVPPAAARRRRRCTWCSR
jgi:hypothetical protein